MRKEQRIRWYGRPDHDRCNTSRILRARCTWNVGAPRSPWSSHKADACFVHLISVNACALHAFVHVCTKWRAQSRNIAVHERICAPTDGGIHTIRFTEEKSTTSERTSFCGSLSRVCSASGTRWRPQGKERCPHPHDSQDVMFGTRVLGKRCLASGTKRELK